MDKINNIGLSRLLTSVYDFEGFTEQEVWCRIAQKINIIIEHFNYLDNKFTNKQLLLEEKIKYLKDEGLQLIVDEVVTDKINKLSSNLIIVGDDGYKYKLNVDGTGNLYTSKVLI